MPRKFCPRLIAANVHFGINHNSINQYNYYYSVQIVHMTLHNDLTFSPLPASFAYDIIVI